MTLVLTLGAVIHHNPRAFAPILRYAHGMTEAAIEWHNSPAPSFYASASH